MSVSDLITAKQFVVDDKGNRTAVLLELEVWEQIVSTLLTLEDDEQLWDEAFADSQDMLAELADEAIAEHRAGYSTPLDPNQL